MGSSLFFLATSSFRSVPFFAFPCRYGEGHGLGVEMHGYWREATGGLVDRGVKGQKRADLWLRQHPWLYGGDGRGGATRAERTPTARTHGAAVAATTNWLGFGNGYEVIEHGLNWAVLSWARAD
ncbi:hypothetical protein M0R45_036055 [Rubus argutus]|uniref:Uncharacterized protein n=1 Tax=Rubus argutus TaxID=59490 RepID=A0AAW1VXR8_RUBAR